MKNKALDLVIELYENSNGASIAIQKNGIITTFETMDESIWVKENILYFAFIEEEIDDFEVVVDDIQKITFEYVENTTLSTIKLKSGDTVTVHNL